ncbi:MAG: CDP-glycerol glycerophosphotransferase family protein [Patescibacteria group bacterium]
MNKTIFIIITRGFLIRNILRSGVLKHLKQPGYKIVILFQTLKGKEIPEYLKDEFGGDFVVFEKISSFPSNNFFDRIYRVFVKWTSLLVYSDSTWSYIRAGNVTNRKRMFFWKYLERFVFSILTKVHFLKYIVRSIEKNVFVSNLYAPYFDKYKPDLVFSTSIIGGIDISFMKEASERGIKTVAMTKGWDHASRVLYRFIPDKIVIQNFVMKEYLIKHQKIDASKIEVCGFPQFDWYNKKELLLGREEFIKSLGLDPDRKLIFFGSAGSNSPKDCDIIDMLAKFINTPGMLMKPACMIVRPHFSDSGVAKYDKYQVMDNIAVDKSMVYSDIIPMGWDYGLKETKFFVNLLHHSDIVVNIASTLTLDACFFDRPIISVAFGVYHNLRNGQDVTNIHYETDHYQDVTKTGGVDVVMNEKELLESVNNYLVHPEYKSAERKILLDKLCYKTDGNSSERIASVILSELKN